MKKIKVAISFLNTDPHTQLVGTMTAICDSMTDNPNYDEVLAKIPALRLEVEDLATKIAAAAQGGTTLTQQMYDARAVVVASGNILALFVQMHCKNNLAILLSSGFKAQKTTRTPSIIPDAPTVQKVRNGANSGTITYKLVSQGVLSYNYRCWLASAPGVYLQLQQLSAANCLFVGLIPGETYFFQGNAMNRAGTSDWSEPFSLMAV